MKKKCFHCCVCSWEEFVKVHDTVVRRRCVPFLNFKMGLFSIGIAAAAKNNALVVAEMERLKTSNSLKRIEGYLRSLWNGPRVLDLPGWFVKAVYSAAQKNGIKLEMNFDIRRAMAGLPQPKNYFVHVAQ